MKFLVLSLAALAFASSAIIPKKNIEIKEDGTLVITGDDGKQIAINKKFGPLGQRDFEIEVTGPAGLAKKIQIDSNNQIKIERGLDFQIPAAYEEDYEQDRSKRASVTTTVAPEVMFQEILKEYQAVLDEPSYTKLLSKIQKGVTKGKYTADAVDFLQALHEDSKTYGTNPYKTSVPAVTSKPVAGQTGVPAGLSKLAQFLDQMYLTKYGQGIFGQKQGQEVYGQQQGVYGQQQGVYGQQQGIYGPQGIYGEQQEMYPQGVYGKQGVYKRETPVQVNPQLVSNILVKFFDQEVLMNTLNQVGYTSYGNIEVVLDNILSVQGIFDYEYLQELIINPVLRKLLVEQGIFNETILDQILAVYNTKGIYNHVLLEKLVNKTVLKQFLAYPGFFEKYVLGYISFNKGLLVKFINSPVWRNVFVQQGVFNREVLQQILPVFYQQGTIPQALLNKLVNKEVLKNLLVQQGIVDEQTLEQLVFNEVLGLRVLLKSTVTPQSYKPTYKQVFGFPAYQQNVEGSYPGVQYPTSFGTYNTLPYFKNALYGQQGQGIYSQYPVMEPKAQ